MSLEIGGIENRAYNHMTKGWEDLWQYGGFNIISILAVSSGISAFKTNEESPDDGRSTLREGQWRWWLLVGRIRPGILSVKAIKFGKNAQWH